VSKVSRSGGKLKDKPETVKASTALPHMLRHTLTRDLLENATSMEEIAELLGNSVAVVEIGSGTSAVSPNWKAGCRASGSVTR
jgi:hypothetical protein